MLSLKSFLSPSPFQAEARAAYLSVVAQSRNPIFYTEYGVPDTLDGRFDLIVLHMFLVMHRLRNEKAGEFIRAFQETFFADMDRSIREMGVSDTGVGKRIKKMSEAFFGRIRAYEESLSDKETLKVSLMRNLYRSDATPNHYAQKMAGYLLQATAHLETQQANVENGYGLQFLDCF